MLQTFFSYKEFPKPLYDSNHLAIEQYQESRDVRHIYIYIYIVELGQLNTQRFVSLLNVNVV